MESGDGAAVRLQEVSVRYGSRLAVVSATAAAEPGSLVCLVGLNGAGKSTLLKAIVGTAASEGVISVLGVSDRRRRALLAYVPQREDVNWGFPISVLEVVLMGRLATLKRLGPDSPSDRAAALAALEAVGIADLHRRPIGELSGGQQQRVVIARALYSAAPVMLLDEPLSGVDPTSGRVIVDLLRALCDGGRTILMATHDIAGSVQLADRVWGINGTVVADVAAAQLTDEEVLRRIYGEHLVVLGGGRLAIGDQAR